MDPNQLPPAPAAPTHAGAQQPGAQPQAGGQRSGAPQPQHQPQPQPGHQGGAPPAPAGAPQPAQASGAQPAGTATAPWPGGAPQSPEAARAAQPGMYPGWVPQMGYVPYPMPGMAPQAPEAARAAQPGMPGAPWPGFMPAPQQPQPHQMSAMPYPGGPQPQPVGPNASVQAFADQVAGGERERCLGIRSAARLAGVGDDIADQLIREGTTLDLARQRVLEARAATHTGGTGGAVDPHVQAGTETTDRYREGITEALYKRCGIPLVGDDGKPRRMKESGSHFQGWSMLRMAEAYLRSRGVSTFGLSQMDLAGVALNCHLRGGAPGMHGGSDFPAIVADVANKRLQSAYDANPKTYEPFTTRNDPPDFKTVHVPQLGEAPALERVGSNGEIKLGTIGEKEETWLLSTYAKRFALTRRAMVNDDTSAFDRLPVLFARSASELQNDIVWALLTANGVMNEDATAIFHADHGNLGTGAGSALDLDALSAGRAAMRVQTGLSGQRISVNPQYLLVPAALETTAQQLTAQVTPNAPTDVNPFVRQFTQVIVEPRLDAASLTAWYMSASPDQVDTIHWGFLQGSDGPMIETRDGWEVEGMEIKAVLDFGAGVIDYRGLYRADGA